MSRSGPVAPRVSLGLTLNLDEATEILHRKAEKRHFALVAEIGKGFVTIGRMVDTFFSSESSNQFLLLSYNT